MNKEIDIIEYAEKGNIFMLLINAILPRPEVC